MVKTKLTQILQPPSNPHRNGRGLPILWAYNFMDGNPSLENGGVTEGPIMIDGIDSESETLRILVYQALKAYKIKPLLKLLFDDNLIVRTAVARELQMRSGRIIFNFLKIHLKNKKAIVREISAFTLGQLGLQEKPFKSQSLALLIPLLKDRSTDVRSAAAAALGHLCSDSMPQSVEKALIKVAKDKSCDVRQCTGFALGYSSGSSEVLEILKDLSVDTNKNVRGWAKVGMNLLKGKKLSKKSPKLE